VTDCTGGIQRSRWTLQLSAVFPILILFVSGCAEPADTPTPEALPQEAFPTKTVVHTDGAPPAVGPYSQAIQVGHTLYLAGQIALDPTTGEMIEGGIEDETHQVMRNLGAVLTAAGFSFDDVVQAQVFLADLNDFAAMNQVYAEYFGQAPPARATVEVSRIPLDARVEILFTAVRSEG
jgi:2-iminobutanoate/2-iminopropanoate deaminase